MRLRATLSIKFYCRETKAGKTGEAPIELGVNCDGNRFFVNLPRRCKPKELQKQKEYTSAVENRIRDYELWCLTRGKRITTEGIKDFIRNGWSCPLENVGYWIDSYLDFVNSKSICKSVKGKHKNVLVLFIKVSGVSREDSLETITPGMVRKFGEYLNTNYKGSTITGMLQKLKTAFQYAVENNLMLTNPFNIKIKRVVPDIDTITWEEYDRLKNLDLGYCKRLEKVRDLFVWSCNTGLSYSDTQLLQPSDFNTNEKGQIYIRKGRNKTGVQYTVVVLPDALEIAKKYDYRLPSISNQKLNTYLKELEDMCQIKEHLTFHKSRHFYARLLLNKYHFSLEVTARCLGHSSTVQTRHYATLFNSTVFEAFENI